MFVGGDKIEGGHYTVVKELGQGGMGMVYHCHDELLQRDVAIKMLLPELTTNKDTLDGFIQEARLAAQLEHPNVVTIYEIGKEERQSKTHHYMAMEYLTGGNLASRINAKQLSIEHCLNWMKQLANGLAYAHKRGIVHQDIKADNIFITTEGDLKIGDFGLARLAAGRAKGRSGHHGMGTPAYMSPELCRGDPQDHRSDIYSMGILFYEMATGQLPFKARGMIEMAMKHASAPIPSARKLNPQVPEALDKVIQKMMSKQPGERYQSMAEVLGLLDDLIFELRVARLGLGPKADAGGKGSGFFKPRVEPAGSPSEQSGDLPINFPRPEPDTPLDPQPAVPAAGAQAFSARPVIQEEQKKQPYVEERPMPPVIEKARTFQDVPRESPVAEPPPAVTPKRHLELLWAFHSFGPIGWRATPSANKEGTIVYCGSSDGTFYALDAQAGSKLWTFETRGPVLSSGVLKLDRVIVSSMDGQLYALSSRTGSLVWKTDLSGPLASPAVLHEETLIAGTMNGEIVSISAKDGRIQWRYKTDDAVVSSAEIVNPSVFVGSKDEHLYAISLSSGALKWKFKTGAIVAGAIASVDSVYVGSTDGSLYAIDLETGKLVWQYETSRPIVSRPVIHFTTVLFCSQDKWLYCCEKYDGHLLWKASVRGRVVANTVSYEGRIYLATREGWVQCFDARTGELVWQMDTKRRLEAAPLVSNDVLYLGTVDGDVLAYSLGDSANLRSA
jgi:serine/threonine-protein kinase